jgi:hypothetical protein
VPAFTLSRKQFAVPLDNLQRARNPPARISQQKSAAGFSSSGAHTFFAPLVAALFFHRACARAV